MPDEDDAVGVIPAIIAVDDEEEEVEAGIIDPEDLDVVDFPEEESEDPLLEGENDGEEDEEEEEYFGDELGFD